MNNTTTAPPRRVRFARETMTPVRLADPLEVDGAIVDEIHVARLTVGAFRAHTEAGGKTETLSLPMFRNGEGQLLPQDVLDGLSFRDAQVVTEVAAGFLNFPSKAEGEAPAPA